MKLKKMYSRISPIYNKIDKIVEPKLDKIESKLKLIEGDIKKIYSDEGVDFKRIFYSQDGEDAVLASFYEDKPNYKGFYIDIGALHPLRFSNTHYFYKKGWRGINIDASPNSMLEFEKVRPHDINVETGISKNDKELIFYSFKEPALNSFNEKISEERIKKGWELIEKIKIKTININDFLDKYLPIGQGIDFINIDVEGLDFEILESLNWEKYESKFLLIEDLDIVDKDIIGYEMSSMYQFLKEKNYSIVARTMRTLIFKKC